MAKKIKTPDATDDPIVTTDPVVIPGDPPVQPDDINWEDRFKGMQRSYEKLQAKFTTLQEKEDTLLEESETTKQTERQKQTELTALQTEQAEAKVELDRLTGELATQEASNTRAQGIMRDFPDLSEFEVNGLLPAAETEEEMVEKFTAFRKSVGSMIKTGVENQVVGTAPTDSGTTSITPIRTKNEIYTEMQNLAGTRDPDKRLRYQELVVEWDEVNKE